MEAPLPIAFASPQKRPHVDDVEPSVTTPNRSAPSNASTPLTVISSLDTPSPIKSKQCAENTPSKSNNSAAGDGNASTQPAPAPASTQPAAKKRKLTQQEKEEQAKEKEIKAQARAEKKAQEDKLKAEQKAQADKLKAEQKAQKDEEKRAKDEEKRKKNEEKEEKKRAKELKQQQEEEEKRKKERVSTTANDSRLIESMLANCCIVADEAQRFLHQTQGYCGARQRSHGRAYPKTLYWPNIFINRHCSDHR